MGPTNTLRRKGMHERKARKYKIEKIKNHRESEVFVAHAQTTIPSVYFPAVHMPKHARA